MIIICKTALFEPWPSLKDSVRFYLVSTSLNFTTIILFTAQGCQLCIQPQPGGPSPCIYVPPWEGSWVIPRGTSFLFRCLLQLTRLWWKYSNLPPHGENINDVSVFSAQHLVHVQGGMVLMQISLTNNTSIFVRYYTAKLHNPLSLVNILNLTD
jgi:hypothetical protein